MVLVRLTISLVLLILFSRGAAAQNVEDRAAFGLDGAWDVFTGSSALSGEAYYDVPIRDVIFTPFFRYTYRENSIFSVGARTGVLFGSTGQYYLGAGFGFMTWEDDASMSIPIVFRAIARVSRIVSITGGANLTPYVFLNDRGWSQYYGLFLGLRFQAQ